LRNSLNKIGILGVSLSSGNRGVEALGTSLLTLCKEACPDSAPVLLISHDKHDPATFRLLGQKIEIPVIPARLSPVADSRDHLFWIVLGSLAYRLVPLSRVRNVLKGRFPWIKAATDAIVVGDIRGGDSFSDIYGISRFLTGFLMAWSVILVKGSMVQFPQTYGPYKSKIAQVLAGYLLKRCSMIMARDEISRRVAQDLTGNRTEVILCPDVAFALDALPPQMLVVDPPVEGIEVPAKVIGLNVNGLMYNGGYTRNNMFGLRMDYRRMLPVLIEKLLELHEGELWFLPHAFAESGNVESDLDTCTRVREALPEHIRRRTRIISAEYDCHELKWIIGQFDFFIGSRMHSCIAALSQGVPCVGIAYSRKFEGVFHTVGMAEWVIDGRSKSDDEAVSRTLSLYGRRDEVRRGLKERAEGAARRLEDTFVGFFRRSSNNGLSP